MSADLGLAVRIAALYAAAFAGNGLYLTFYPIWLADRGFPAAEIGLIIGLPIFVRAAVSPFIAFQADRAFGVRPLLLITSLVAAAGFFALPLASGFIAVLFVTSIAFAAQGPAGPLTDIVAIESLRRRPRLHYGRLRMWGSASFIAASLGGGALVGVFSPSSIPTLLALSALLAAAMAFAAPRGTAREPERPDGAPAEEPAASRRLVLLIILATAFSHASHAMIYTFGSIMLQKAGFSSAAIGLIWASGVVVEITLFAVVGAAAGPGFPAFTFLAIGAGVGIARWIGLATGVEGAWLVLLIALHGITFGATLLGSIGAFARIPSGGRRGRQQGLFIAVNATLNGITTAACGPLYEAFGAASFLAMVPVGMASLGATAWAARIAANPVQPHKAGAGG
ncbi:MFS transporter [uncultured Alsobacter sp.]|uniref:MFS transporter n=1 Tax=uncultured Alsobacter sp. TaxID=1748258 RepID=UPI0025EE9354|nr:MFS transporter [uncultured Alsobacter sp.]